MTTGKTIALIRQTFVKLCGSQQTVENSYRENSYLSPEKLYSSQEDTVRTGYGTDWFQIEKGVCQGCGLSSAHVWMRELDCEES